MQFLKRPCRAQVLCFYAFCAKTVETVTHYQVVYCLCIKKNNFYRGTHCLQFHAWVACLICPSPAEPCSGPHFSCGAGQGSRHWAQRHQAALNGKISSILKGCLLQVTIKANNIGQSHYCCNFDSAYHVSGF